MRYEGKVIRKCYAPGSKSEYEAVMLATPEGTYRLQREGGNPFGDEQLDALVGQDIVAEGRLHRQTLIVKSWEPQGG